MPSLKFANGEFLLTNASKEEKYRHLIRTFSGTVTNLTASKSSSKLLNSIYDLTENAVFERSGDVAEKIQGLMPPFTKSINGTFRLGVSERFDRSSDKIGVIGNEELFTNVLSISFNSLNSDQFAEWQQNKKENLERTYNWRNVGRHVWGAGGCSLGYIAPDWEIGNTEEWYLSVYLPENLFDEFFETVSANKTSECFCSFDFPFFTNQAYHVPSSSMTYYLPPAVEFQSRIEGKEETYNFSEPHYVEGFLERLSFNVGAHISANPSNVVNEIHNTYTSNDKKDATDKLGTLAKKAADSWIFWVSLCVVIYLLRK